MSRNRGDTGGADIAHLAEVLAAVHIRNMHLNRGDRNRLHGIQYGDARMGVCAGIDHDAVDFLKIGILNFIHKRALVIGLEKLDFHPELLFGGGLAQMGLSTPDLAVLGGAILVLLIADTLKYNGIGANALILNSNIIIRFILVLALLFSVLVFGIYGAGYEAAQFIYFQF